MRPTSCIRIAVADDHNFYRKHLCHHLELLGLEVVIAAGNGQQLLDMLAATAPIPDLCVIDVHMPVMDGLTAVARIKASWSGLKVISMSMDHSTDIMQRAAAAGADLFLEKGTNPRHLYHAILALTGKKTGPAEADPAS